MSKRDYDLTDLKQEEYVNIIVPNGYFVISRQDVGFVVDFYDQADNCDHTMTVWDCDVNNQESDHE